MAEYDGSIRIVTKITTKDAEESLASLEWKIKNSAKVMDDLRKKMDSLKGQKIPTEQYKKLENDLAAATKEMEKMVAQDSKFAGIGAKIKSLTQSSAEYAAKMKEVAEQNIPTEAYASVQKQITETEKKLNSLQKRQERFLALGGNEEDSTYKKMAYDVDILQKKLSNLHRSAEAIEKRGFAFTPGEETEQYKNLLAKYNSVNQELEKEKALHGEIASKQAESVQKAIELKAQMQALVDTGKAFTLGENTAQYKTWENQLKAEEEAVVKWGAHYKKLLSSAPESFSKMKQSAQKAFNALASGFSKVGNVGKKTFSGISIMAKKAFSGIFGNIKKGGGLFSAFSSRLKGLALSLLIFNWISRGFNSMISGIKEGMSNLAKISSPVNSNISMLISSLAQLKNALATAFAPILNVIAPIITSFINMLSQAATYVGMFIATLTGASSFTKAVAVQKDYAKSLNATAGAAKKAVGALARFDDLDVLQKQESGGGGVGGISPEDMFEEVPIPSKFKKIADLFKKMWENSDFYELGKMLGEKLKDALDSIPWAAIKESARKIGKGIASLINGFIEVKGLGFSIGRTLAEVLNTAFEFLNSFVHELHWESVGNFIADTLNGLLKNIDWDLIYDTFVTYAKGLGDALNSFVDNLDWGEIATAISNMVNTFASTVYEFFSTVDWSEAGHKIGQTIKETIEKIDFEEIGRALGGILHSAIEFLNSILSELSIKDIVDAIHDLFKGFFEGATWEDIATIVLAGINLALIGAAKTWTFGVAASLIKLALGSSIGTAVAGVGETEAVTGGFATLGVKLVQLVGDLAITTAAAFGAFELIKNPLIDFLADLNGNTDEAVAKAEYMKEKYAGFSGTIDIVKDSFGVLGSAIGGLPVRVNDSSQAFAALEDAMTAIGDGMIYTDEQLAKMQDKWGLTAEDVEMLRQAMLDANEPLRKLADDFGLFDASAQTLEDIAGGMDVLKNTTGDTQHVLDLMTGSQSAMTEEAKTFFSTLSESGMTIDEYKKHIEDMVTTTDGLSGKMTDAGKNINIGLSNGLKENMDIPVGSIKEVMDSMDKSVHGGVWRFGSPSETAKDYGKWIDEGMAMGITGNAQIVIDALSQLVNSMLEAFNINFGVEKWTENGAYLMEGLALGVSENMGGVDEAFTLLFELIHQKWTEILTDSELTWNQMIELIKNAILLIQNNLRTSMDAVNINWKSQWNQMLTTVRTLCNEMVSIVQSAASAIQAACASIIAAVNAAKAAAASLGGVGGGGASSRGGGGGVSVAPRMAIPALASGSVIRGGNPFLAILGDQPAGQTNIETPLSTMVDAFKQAMRENGGGGGDRVPVNINLNYNGETFARLSLSDILAEAGRQGYNVEILGVT